MEEIKKQTHINTAIATTALIVTICAFVIAVSAFNKTGKPLDEVIGQSASESAEDVRLATVRAETEARLALLGTQARAGEVQADLADEVASIRADLSAAYQGTKEEANMKYKKMDLSLTKLEADLRSGAAGVLASLENALSAVREEIED